MNTILIVAGKEFRDDFRNRWTVALTVLFALLALGIAWFGSAAAGKVGFTSFDATLASLTTLGAFVIPLIGLLIAYDAIVGERDDGTLKRRSLRRRPKGQAAASSRSQMAWYSCGKRSSSSSDTHSSTLWIVALTGPSSITSAPSGAMKRPSEVPPPVLCSGSMPHSSRHTATTVSRSTPPGGVRKGSPERFHSSA